MKEEVKATKQQRKTRWKEGIWFIKCRVGWIQGLCFFTMCSTGRPPANIKILIGMKKRCLCVANLPDIRLLVWYYRAGRPTHLSGAKSHLPLKLCRHRSAGTVTVEITKHDFFQGRAPGSFFYQLKRKTHYLNTFIWRVTYLQTSWLNGIQEETFLFYYAKIFGENSTHTGSHKDTYTLQEHGLFFNSQEFILKGCDHN